MMLANLGDCFLKQKQPANALVCLNAALEMNPDSAKSHKIFTKASCALGKWEDALKHAQLALKIDFDDMAYETEKILNSKLGPIHEKKAQLQNAQKDLEFAQKLAKQDELREQRKKEQQEEAARRMADMQGGMGGFPGGGMPGGDLLYTFRETNSDSCEKLIVGMPGGMDGMAGMMNDPDIQALYTDKFFVAVVTTLQPQPDTLVCVSRLLCRTQR